MTPAADLRDYLAEERTFLAWIRTGLALMAFGFVVARFGLYLAEIHSPQDGATVSSSGFSLWAGTGIIGVGIVMNLLSIRRHVLVVERLNQGQFDRGPSYQAVILALIMALVGLAAGLHLILS